MESFIGRLEEEGLSSFLDAQNVAELAVLVDSRILCYNTDRRYSSVGIVLPQTYIGRVRAGSAERWPPGV